MLVWLSQAFQLSKSTQEGIGKNLIQIQFISPGKTENLSKYSETYLFLDHFTYVKWQMVGKMSRYGDFWNWVSTRWQVNYLALRAIAGWLGSWVRLRYAALLSCSSMTSACSNNCKKTIYNNINSMQTSQWYKCESIILFYQEFLLNSSKSSILCIYF